MSSKTMSTFLLIATILYATTSPLAHATFFNFINPTTNIIISGRVCCTATGACPAATTPGIAGATATLNCPPLGVVATTTTDAGGNFFFNANSPQTFVPTACTVTIALPLTGAAATSCVLLTGVGVTGALVSPVTGSFSNNFGGFPFFFSFLFNGQRNFNGVATGFTRTA